MKKFVICLFAVLLLGMTCAMATSMPGDVYDWDWYQNPQPQQDGAAHLVLEARWSPVKISYRPSTSDIPYSWNIMYAYFERGGVDFTIEQVTEVYFDENHVATDVFVTNGIGLENFGPNGCVPAGAGIGYNTWRPAGNEVAYGVAIRGTDANGNQLTFGLCIPLSQEIERVYGKADLQATAPRQEGKAYMSLTPYQNPSPLVDDATFDGGKGWYYGFTMLNETDVAFTPTQLVEVCVATNGDTYPMVYSAEELVGYGMPAVFEKDASWYFGGGMPVQSAAAVGFVLSGTDATGAELEFACYIDLEQP